MIQKENMQFRLKTDERLIIKVLAIGNGPLELGYMG